MNKTKQECKDLLLSIQAGSIPTSSDQPLVTALSQMLHNCLKELAPTNKLDQLLLQKRREVSLNFDDVFTHTEDPDWMKEPIGSGGVKLKYSCILCGEVVLKMQPIRMEDHTKKALNDHIDKHRNEQT